MAADAALGAPASCKLEDVLAADLGGMPVRSCGKLDVHATADELTAAKSCVLAAVEALEPFQVQWDMVGADSRVAHAYVGLAGEEASLEIRSYSYDGNRRGVGGSESLPSTWISRCGGLRAKDGCEGEQLRYSLCLECATLVELPGCLTEGP
ncbi:MAG TPA: hypothetical protein VGK67_02515 [Myxococcales bacterium]